jgi:acyl-CoA thioester hydrolase
MQRLWPNTVSLHQYNPRNHLNDSRSRAVYRAVRSSQSIILPTVVSSFNLRLRVLPSDIDEQNHVNNLVYLRWVQEIAIAHWKAVASSEAQEAIGWVVLRHEIDYNAPAVLHDELEVATWVGKATRLTFERFTEIRRGADRQLLAKARRSGARLVRAAAVQFGYRLKCATSSQPDRRSHTEDRLMTVFAERFVRRHRVSDRFLRIRRHVWT